MGPQTYSETYTASQPAPQPRRRGLLGRGYRKMTWVIVAWSALVVVGGLALAGHAGNQISSACHKSLGNGSVCQQLTSQTATAQFEHVLKLGFVGFVILSVIWFMTRPQSRKSA